MISIEVMNDVKKLLRKGKIYFGDEADTLFTSLYFLILDALKGLQLSQLCIDKARQLPYEFILKANEILERNEINKVEFEWDVPGFNDWFKKRFGITVEEAAKQAND